jgi:hypothetical protein
MLTASNGVHTCHCVNFPPQKVALRSFFCARLSGMFLLAGMPRLEVPKWLIRSVCQLFGSVIVLASNVL